MNGEWIKVEDRLPKKATNVLLTEEVHYSSGKICNRVVLAWCGGDDYEWYDVEDDVIVAHPVAWMPLPAPSKEDENGA